MRPYGPLRGRDHELSTALAVIRRTRTHGASGVVLVSGNAGVGKTALLSEICRQATHMNIRVARSKCDEIEQAWPGAPMVGLLRTGRDPLLSAPEFHQINGLTAEPLLLVDRIAGHLARLADGQRLLIAVDDVQWADRVSRYALRALITRLVGVPVVWVLTSRSDDVGLAVSAADSVGVEHIRLNPLADPTIAEIARDRLGPNIDSRVVEMLDAAGGNAFLAVQIIDAVAQRSETGGMDAVPAQFRSAVRQRLSGLSVEALRLVEAVAVAGRPVSIVDLAGVCEMTVNPTYDNAVNDAVASALVKSTGAELSFGHDLVKDAVYELIAPHVRRRLHTRFARHFVDMAGDPVLAAAHARAAATVGDDANARIMLDAADALITTGAVDAADLALQAFQTLRPGQSHWLELGERAVSVLSRTQRATDTIAAADVLLATVDDADVVARIETHTVKPMWLAGHSAALIERADRAIARAGTRHDLVARFRAARALAHTRILAADQATADAEAALAEARASHDHDALALALQAAGEAAHNERRHQLALKYFRELHSVTGVPYLAEEIMELQLLDRYDDAQILLDGATSDSRAKDGSVLPDLLFAQLKQHYNLGRLREADQTASLLIELGQVTGTTVHVIEGILMRTTVALLRGESELAAQRLRPALRLEGDDAIRHPGMSLLSGWLSTEQGDVDSGRRMLTQMLETSQRTHSYWAWWPCFATVLFSIGLISGATNITERTVEFTDEGARRNPEVASLNGLALNLRGMLGGDLVMVAESVKILHDSPRPVLRAAGAEGYGRLLMSAGEREAALDQLDAAWDVYDRMGALAPRARVQRLMRAAGARRAKWVGDRADVSEAALTEAERRVAYLIANGHTNKSTAKSLGISINTVGTHLRSIYSKLGVQSRVQLANVLREQGEIA
jgi:DNA-binding CsgD family transcriptional regulator/tetratricopeptide (TPR) repeat protein